MSYLYQQLQGKSPIRAIDINNLPAFLESLELLQGLADAINYCQDNTGVSVKILLNVYRVAGSAKVVPKISEEMDTFLTNLDLLSSITYDIKSVTEGKTRDLYLITISSK